MEQIIHFDACGHISGVPLVELQSGRQHQHGLGNCLFDDFYLMPGSVKSKTRIWGGYLSGIAGRLEY